MIQINEYYVKLKILLGCPLGVMIKSLDLWYRSNHVRNPVAILHLLPTNTLITQLVGTVEYTNAPLQRGKTPAIEFWILH